MFRSNPFRTLTFLLALFAGAFFYSWIAYFDLPFLTTTGRLGPGFFPRIVGAGMVVLLGWALVEELARRPLAGTGTAGGEPDMETDTGMGTAPAVATMMALGLGFLLAIIVLGGVLGSVLFLLATLNVFNRGDHLRNLAVALVIPVLIYVVFVVLLNADMPDGLVPLPF